MAWSQVAGAFLLTFNSWGPFLSFGVFQDYYQETSLSHFAPSTISWIGTVQGFLLIVIGTFTGPLFDLGHMRGLLGTGTVLIFLGFLVASEVRDYFGVFLSHSILLGLGSGCLFVPSVAIVTQWFAPSQRPLATGIAAAGGTFGGVVIPTIFKASLNAFGAGWGYKILGFIALATLAIPCFLLQTRSVPKRDRTRRALLDLSAFSDLTFMFFSLALFFSFTGLYIPFYYVASYAKSNLGVTTSLTFGILSAMNTGALFGRALPSLAANYFGSINILIFVTLTCSIVHFCWITAHTLTGILTFGISYGFFAGAVVSLPMSAFTELWPDVNQAGRRFGLSYSFAGFGILVGSPIAGILMSRFGYQALQIFGGVFIMLGFLSISAARLTLPGNARRTFL
ncbi:MFS monocarboxylate transporter-like protein [Coniochaeta sp. 2T2.1]|nr:MFS monocarboxylate transporter-like protein [Coniochaeta sp. 2T2.1]